MVDLGHCYVIIQRKLYISEGEVCVYCCLYGIISLEVSLDFVRIELKPSSRF